MRLALFVYTKTDLSPHDYLLLAPAMLPAHATCTGHSLVFHDYCCCFFCAAGPISLLKAMYETSRFAIALTPTDRMRKSSKVTAPPMKMPSREG